MSLLLEALRAGAARGAANLAALCTWARHVYGLAVESSQMDADVRFFRGPVYMYIMYSTPRLESYRRSKVFGYTLSCFI